MDDDKSLSHTTWTCKHHVGSIPTPRRKAPYQELRPTLALQKGIERDRGAVWSGALAGGRGRRFEDGRGRAGRREEPRQALPGQQFQA